MQLKKICYLCLAETNAERTLFSFPKDAATKSKWISACGFNENDNVDHLKICSDHFTTKEFIEPRAKEFGSRLRLVSGAVPNKYIPQLDPPPPPLVEDTEEVPMDEILPSNSPPLSPHSPTQGDLEIVPDVSSFTFQERPNGDACEVENATLNRARHKLFIAEHKLKNQAFKIKALQARNRRLLKRIATLQDMMTEMIETLLLSGGDRDALVLCVE